MKKIAFALVALLIALSPLAAGESWVGVTKDLLSRSRSPTISRM